MSEAGKTSADNSAEEMPLPLLAGRSAVGGVLMGLANLVPGISGGTMLLAAGVYTHFIQAIADLSTLKFKKVSLVVLAVVVATAGLSILLFAGPVKAMVVEHRWVMYSLFIGLSLGGLPVVWDMAKPATGSLWGGAAAGFAMMALIAVAQSGNGGSEQSGSAGMVLMFLAGVAGASAMILPGISGGYLLLVLGVYVPILGAIDTLKTALKARDIEALMDPTINVVLPVGVGVVIGVVAVSNLLKIALAKFEKPTLGALLGFLAGAVIGLWPFQQGVKPAVGDVVKGRTMTLELIEKMKPEKYPTEYFDPTMGQIAGSIGLIILGFAVTALVARLGKSKPAKK